MAFNAKALLDQLFGQGQAMLGERGANGDARSRRSRDEGAFGRFGGGMAAGGALGLLLGNKRVRRLGGGALSHGGAAVLGAMAYRGYTEWQAQQGGRRQAEAPRTLDRVPESEAEAQSRAVLIVVVGAARADGHIDQRERRLIESEIERMGAAQELRDWLDAELGRPLDPAAIAAAADSQVVASEMYLASRLVVDEENFMERAYLDELAHCMGLDSELQRRLDQQVVAARSG